MNAHHFRLLLALVFVVGACSKVPAQENASPRNLRLHLRWVDTGMLKERWVRSTDEDGKVTYGERLVGPKSSERSGGASRYRFVTVFVRNDGLEDIKDFPAQVLVFGRKPEERQFDEVSLTIAKNREQALDIILRTDSLVPGGGAWSRGSSGGFTGLSGGGAVGDPVAPVKKVQRVELIVPLRFPASPK